MKARRSTTARIISVGDELLTGRTSDTNATVIQRALLPHAVQVRDVLVVRDNIEAIEAALARTDPGDVVFLCGGLGSTADDLTRQGLAAWAGVELQYSRELADALAERRSRRGLARLAAPDPQAMVPAGCDPVCNPVGTAPGLVGDLGARRVAVLPGVPHELSALLPPVLAALGHPFDLPEARPVLLRRTAQIAELQIALLTEPVRCRYPQLGWSWWLVPWGVDIQVSGEAEQGPMLEQVGHDLDALLDDVVYARRLVSLPKTVQDLMRARGLTLAVAESCTGGQLGAVITSEEGSSGHFLGGVMSYADSAKKDLLGVEAQMLAEHGAVSRLVAEQMAEKVRRALNSDYALAITGIAGPGGGSPEKPVGLTWLALAGPGKVQSGCYRFSADRDRNRHLAVAAALDAMRRALLELPVFPVDRLSWGRSA
jgi:nicotinamide-nucleotide amidase